MPALITCSKCSAVCHQRPDNLCCQCRLGQKSNKRVPCSSCGRPCNNKTGSTEQKCFTCNKIESKPVKKEAPK